MYSASSCVVFFALFLLKYLDELNTCKPRIKKPNKNNLCSHSHAAWPPWSELSCLPWLHCVDPLNDNASSLYSELSCEFHISHSDMRLLLISSSTSQHRSGYGYFPKCYFWTFFLPCVNLLYFQPRTAAQLSQTNAVETVDVYLV